MTIRSPQVAAAGSGARADRRARSVPEAKGGDAIAPGRPAIEVPAQPDEQFIMRESDAVSALDRPARALAA